MKYLIGFLFFASRVYAQDYTIYGSWQLDVNSTMQLMRGVYKTKFEDLPEPKKAAIIDDFSKRTFSFNADGKFLAKWYNGKVFQSDEGEWLVLDSKLSITINGKVHIYTVTHLTASYLEIKKVGNDAGLFNTLAFNRQ